ncbi:hypothetical protein D3C81_1557150 [compost metagenome]
MERLGHAAHGAQHRRSTGRGRHPAPVPARRRHRAGGRALCLQRARARSPYPRGNPQAPDPADLAGSGARQAGPGPREPGPCPVRRELRLLPRAQCGAAGATHGPRPRPGMAHAHRARRHRRHRLHHRRQHRRPPFRYQQAGLDPGATVQARRQAVRHQPGTGGLQQYLQRQGARLHHRLRRRPGLQAGRGLR